ncbi:MAG: alpha/beta hydrolase [Anaerolineae bacterium]|nr:alpha/beta hydrolase [Anaerolineae bacterium]
MSTHDQPSLHVAGFDLPYLIEGTGRPVIVIGDTNYYPRTFSAALRQHLQMIFMSHRGFGRATAPFTSADFELDVLVDDIEALRQHLNLAQVIIVGHSGHGYIALEYAKKYPQHVSHVVLLALSPDSTFASFQTADQYLEESVCPERKTALAESLNRLPAAIEAQPERAFILRMLHSGPRIWYDYTYDASHLWEGVEIIPAMFDYVWGTLFRTLDITTGLESVTPPVFLGLGRYDYWNPPHLWERCRGQFHDLRMRVFERSGHTPQLEEQAAFDRELLRWLGEIE